MIELSDLGDGRMALAYGGDSLNTSVYLARLGKSRDICVDYITALGDDPYSDAMLDFWQSEGIGTDLVQRLEGRLPGLYAIQTDAAGERSFHNWRSASAARELFRAGDSDQIIEAIEGYDVIYVTGVTLSILDPASQTRLLDAVDGARTNGARVVFDSNYRPRGWPEAATARRSIGEFYHRADIALPTLEDEQMLFDYPSAEALIDTLITCGVGECAVKDGARPCVIYSGDKIERIDVEPAFEVVDTTAAGDAFNAAYLVHRLRGGAPAEAARAGIKLATEVIRHRGAVIPAGAMPEFD